MSMTIGNARRLHELAALAETWNGNRPEPLVGATYTAWLAAVLARVSGEIESDNPAENEPLESLLT